MLKKDYDCLMIQTKDNRRFFTHQKNYVQLIEFANTFDAEIVQVHLEEGEVLDLAPLAAALTDARYVNQGTYTVIGKTAEAERPTVVVVKNMTAAKEIKEYMLSIFEAGGIVDFHDLMDKFSAYNLSYNAYAAHLFKMKRELKKQGHHVEKVGAGRYRVIPQASLREDRVAW